MNTLLNILRTLFVATVAFVIIFASYFFIALGGDETKISFGNNSENIVVQRDLNETDRNLSEYLSELKKVELDVDFFLKTDTPASVAFDELTAEYNSDGTTKKLKFNRELPQLTASRKNPFEPIE